MVKRSTWFLLVILLLVLGIYLVLRYRPANKNLESTPTAIGNTFLVNEANAKLQSIRINDKQSKVVQIERGVDGQWTIRLPISTIADQGMAEAAETQVGALRIVTKLETVPPLDAIGLDSPADTIRLTYTSGVQHTVEVGNTTPTSSGYYVRLDGSDVFVVSQSGIESLLNLLDNPPYPATETPAPTPTPTSIVETVTPTP